METIPAWLLFFWLFCACIGAGMAYDKNAAGSGFILGLILGPLGILLACFLDNRPKCPHCGGRLAGHYYEKCQNCGTNLREPLETERTVACPYCDAALSAIHRPSLCKNCNQEIAWYFAEPCTPAHLEAFRQEERERVEHEQETERIAKEKAAQKKERRIQKRAHRREHRKKLIRKSRDVSSNLYSRWKSAIDCESDMVAASLLFVLSLVPFVLLFLLVAVLQ